MKRRHFLTTAAAATLPRAARASEAGITILPQETLGTISPMLHGHFVEHLGGVVYDGIWVGEGSRIANVAGIRKSLVDALKAIHAPVFRWPGGCFADSYNWKDGIGPRSQRPRRTNFWAGHPDLVKLPPNPAQYDPNQFGTNEFVRFCREAGGEPYIAANVRSGSPRDFDEWVEYCNSPAGSTTLADQRGTPPFGVQYWGIGNESWGCGGDFTPEEYSAEFRKFTAWVPGFGVPLKYLPAGPNGGDLNWTRGFFRALCQKDRGMLNKVWGFALHYYSGTAGKGHATEFTVDDWYELLGKADHMETLINNHWSAMGEFDPERKVKLVVDEWGTWHRAGTEVAPHHLLGQVATMRDALVAAITLDTFHRHASKIGMANIAQLINCLQSLFLAHEDKFVVTPNYHVFQMYMAHHNAKAVRAVFAAPGAPKGAPGLSGSASVKDKTLTLTCVNCHHDHALPVEISAPGMKLEGARVEVLAADALNAHNSFVAPSAVMPKAGKAEAAGGSLRLDIPAASVVKITATIV